MTYTAEQIRFVKENRRTMSNAELSKALNITFYQLSYLIKTQGLTLIHRKRFTEEENNFIREKIKTNSIVEVAEMLGKTKGSVDSAIKRMGIDRQNIPKTTRVFKKAEKKKIQRPPAIYDNKGHIYLINKYSEAI